MLKLLPRLLGEDIQLTCVADPDLWPVRMDPSQVDQILTNLCVNARKAIDGVGVISVETANCALDDPYCAARLQARPGDFVRLTVRDSGRGMDEETLNHIFEPFFTTGDSGEGSIGLGLATVFGAVTQNHGFIDVRSAPGAGATFDIFLPRHVGTIDAVPLSAVPLPPRVRQETILLVEDEPALLRVTSRMLEARGFSVLCASTPAEAMQVIDDSAVSIDLLLTDVIMPTMNGRELTAVAQTRRPQLRSLYMSGYPADVIAKSGVLDDRVQLLQKPFDSNTLARKIRDTLDAR
jgi:CheY-like chemotaxis protein